MPSFKNLREGEKPMQAVFGVLLGLAGVVVMVRSAKGSLVSFLIGDALALVGAVLFFSAPAQLSSLRALSPFAFIFGVTLITEASQHEEGWFAARGLEVRIPVGFVGFLLAVGGIALFLVT